MTHPLNRRLSRATAVLGGWALIAGTALVGLPTATAEIEVAPPEAELADESIAPVELAPLAVATTAPVVINEVYGGGGNSGATFSHDFVELRNVGDDAVDLSGWSVQYASAAGTNWSGQIPLSGTIEAGGYYLVQGGSNNVNVGAPLPVAADASGNVNFAGANGNIALVTGTGALSCHTTACAADGRVIDLVGFGSGAAFAGTAAAPAPSNTTAISRDAAGTNTADNAADFTVITPPTPQGGDVVDVTPVDPELLSIAEVREGGLGKPVITRGVVTAHYPTGGFGGYVIQTPGTGGELVDTQEFSDAVFVYSSATVGSVEIGDYVEVAGTTGEFNGLFQLTNVTVTDLDETVAAPTPLEIPWPTTAAEREAIESMLILPQGEFTISNTYNPQFGEIGAAVGTEPLQQPIALYAPGTAEAEAVRADNFARGLIIDDGASWNYLSNPAARDFAPPYVNLENPLRVGAPLTINEPLIVDYRNDAWKLNPTTQVFASSDLGDYPVSWLSTRTLAPSPVGGDLTVASFNVLNYFTTLGADTAGCVSYPDRDGNPVTVRQDCLPRGAWGPADFERQQEKLVAAINTVDASVVGLMEIENSAKLSETPDEAIASLVAALNADAGSDKWAYVAPASDKLPAITEQDVITNAVIYQPAEVTPVGAAVSIANQSGAGQPFVNAREPIGARFAPTADPTAAPLLVVVNHFKSKGSEGPFPGDADDGWQGASNASRVLQATALTAWVDEITTDGEAVALIGDFNSYAQEDPMQVLYGAGYTNVETYFDVADASYVFQGMSGSLDYVLLNDAALERATGATIWPINSGESLALEYSRYNNYAADYHEPNPFRSSDHDPVVVGLNASVAPQESLLRLLNINDFHGRIDTNTVSFAGTIEELRAAATADGGSSLFLSAGDNIGASLFASSLQQDQPTIDVLNALGLAASAVGNHEFDQGLTDLVDRVIDGGNNATWDYLAANVTNTATGELVLPPFATFEVDGLTVAVIGAVTRETPSLVAPAGVAGLTFGDPVDAINTYAALLSDGDESNGEADIIIAEYHDGAGAGVPDGSTLEQEVAAGGTFAKIVEQTSADVDVIFTGHTHKQYAWDGPVPGVAGKTRPVVQTGSYGEFIGLVDLVIGEDGDVVSYEARNVGRTSTPVAELIAQFPAVAEVDAIVRDALDAAAVIGDEPVGSVTSDITTAYIGGAYVDGVYVWPNPNDPDPANPSGGRDDRASESALGNLVADALVASLSDPAIGGAEIGVVNPGGLRNELFYGEDGVITYAEANAVLPFVNNLWTTTLTGEQFKIMLEQQWQTNADGTIPSRPYLQLGLSQNVSYTFDDTRPMGDRITSVTVNGAPLDPAAEYRIGSFSFLLEGGDNFRIFTEGTDTRDSGLVDRDAWIAYIQSHSPLSPDFSQRGVQATPLGEAAAGSDVSFAVAGLGLRSLGAPEITEITVSLGASTLGTFPVVDGAASITATIPNDAATGATALQLVTGQSGTEVLLPITVTAGSVVPTPTPTPTPTEPVTPTPTPPGGNLPITGAEHGESGIMIAAALAAAGVLLLAVSARRRAALSRD